MKPFESFENACRELLRYHVYYEPLPEDEDIEKCMNLMLFVNLFVDYDENQIIIT